jgi:hypothetical protein
MTQAKNETLGEGTDSPGMLPKIDSFQPGHMGGQKVPACSVQRRDAGHARCSVYYICG